MRAGRSSRRPRGAAGRLRAALGAGACVAVFGLALGAAADPLAPDAAVAERAASVRAAKATLACAATALLALGAWLRRRGRPEAFGTLRDAALAALGAGGLLGSWNFLSFHYTGIVHAHELFNYAVGSRYFPELGYERLYECVAVADAEAGLGARVARRRITDLASPSYALRDAREVLADPGRCKQRFAPERWRAFARDVAFFRGLFAPEPWEDLQRDHGFNATPAWAALGRAVTGSRPFTRTGLLLLASLDPLLDFAAWGLVASAFGWRATCVALVYWGTNQPAGYEWTGGALLRHDWLAALLVGLACLRRARPFAAGALFGAAALLRAFPLVLLVGPGLAAVAASLRARRPVLPPETRRLAAGALGAAAAGLALAAASVGVGAWPRFASHLAHHTSVPASNTMGLRTALSYTQEGRLARLLESDPDPGEAWKRRRLAAFDARRPLFLALAAAFAALLAAACAREPLWVAALLGTGLVPFLLDGACYYTAFLAAWGLLWLRREAVGVALCALAALQWAIAARLPEPDDAFVASSVAMLGFVALATALLALPRRSPEP